MKEEKSKTSRKNFFIGALALLTSLTAFKFLLPKNNKKDTVKMLTQGGKLVEIDRSILPSKGKKITEDDLKKWVQY